MVSKVEKTVQVSVDDNIRSFDPVQSIATNQKVSRGLLSTWICYGRTQPARDQTESFSTIMLILWSVLGDVISLERGRFPDSYPQYRRCCITLNWVESILEDRIPTKNGTCFVLSFQVGRLVILSRSDCYPLEDKIR